MTEKELIKELSLVPSIELLRVCKKFAINANNCTKKQIIQLICERYYSIKKYMNYTYIHQLGREGKDGRTYLALNEHNKQVAIKIFSPKKSSNTINREAKLQMIAASHGIAPKVFEYDGDGKYIVMEKLDINLFDCFRAQKGQLTREQQKALIRLFKKLDELCCPSFLFIVLPCYPVLVLAQTSNQCLTARYISIAINGAVVSPYGITCSTDTSKITESKWLKRNLRNSISATIGSLVNLM